MVDSIVQVSYSFIDVMSTCFIFARNVGISPSLYICQFSFSVLSGFFFVCLFHIFRIFIIGV
jgi:hypothetical protein